MLCQSFVIYPNTANNLSFWLNCSIWRCFCLCLSLVIVAIYLQFVDSFISSCWLLKSAPVYFLEYVHIGEFMIHKHLNCILHCLGNFVQILLGIDQCFFSSFHPLSQYWTYYSTISPYNTLPLIVIDGWLLAWVIVPDTCA